MQVSLAVNGEQHALEIEPRVLLVDLLRERLGMTGTKVGCDTSQCGSCVVTLNGISVKSCTVLAAQADGAEVGTVEGLATNGQLNPLQQGFWQEHGLQCGFCTPGMLMSISDLLSHHNADPPVRDTHLARRQPLSLHRLPALRPGCPARRPHHRKAVNMIADTPGKQFYEEQVKYLLDKDVENLVPIDKHYHDDAVIVSFDHIVRGKDELKAFTSRDLSIGHDQRVISTDKLTETEDALMFEATVQFNHGVIKTFDALVLEAGRIRLQFTGVR